MTPRNYACGHRRPPTVPARAWQSCPACTAITAVAHERYGRLEDRWFPVVVVVLLLVLAAAAGFR
jgi:hypothetical protein